jgi:serine/threonine protein kinase
MSWRLACSKGQPDTSKNPVFGLIQIYASTQSVIGATRQIESLHAITMSTSYSSELLPVTTGHAQILYGDIGTQTIVGQGYAGIVKKAQWGKLTVAIKYLHNTRELKREFNNLERVFGGEHIVALYGLTTNEHGQTGIVMEYCTNGTLCDYLKSNFQQFTWDNKLNMAQDIAKGLRFVHKQGLLHRDLHDCNILVNDSGHALIADFGLARPITRTETSGSRIGRIAFMPPERLMEETGPFTERGDIYSLGVILWELTAGRQPFYGKTNFAVGIAVSRKSRRRHAGTVSRDLH